VSWICRVYRAGDTGDFILTGGTLSCGNPCIPLVIQVFLWIHYSLLLIDTGMFAAYISASIYGAVKELIRYVKGL
jgi:hypothetical protein